MKNIERQKRLDKKKWLESEKLDQNLSGQMDYCEFCDCADIYNWGYCAYDSKTATELCKCAKAYNKMIRDAK